MGKRTTAASAELERPPLASVTDSDSDQPPDDPIEAAMADMDELRAELEGMAADDFDEPVLPPEFDVFEANPECVHKMRERGADPTVVRIQVFSVQGGRRGKMIRSFRPEGVTYARLCRKLPPGRYDVQAYSADRCFVGGKRITVTDRSTAEDIAPELNDPASIDSGEAGSSWGKRGDRLVWELAMRALRGHESQGSSSEIREAMAGMLKLQQAQLAMQQTELQNRLALFEAETKAKRGGTNDQLSLLTTVLDLVDKRGGRARSGKGPDASDFVGILQLGMHLAGARKEPERMDDDWIERLFLPLADQLGPQLVTMLAMLFPDEKAKIIIDTLSQHLKTREAEAKAAAAEDEPDSVLEAHGETIEK